MADVKSMSSEERKRAFMDAVLGKAPPGSLFAAEIEAARKGHYVLDIPNEIPDLDDWPDAHAVAVPSSPKP